MTLRGASGKGVLRARGSVQAALDRRVKVRRNWLSMRRWVSAVLGPVVAAGTSLVPATAVIVAAAASVAAVSVAAAPAAQASTAGDVLVVLVNGEASAPEASLVSAAGYTVTTVTPAVLAAMSQATFAGYAAVVIGDSSSASTCAATAPATSGLGSQWEPWVTGNVAVLGTAPELAAQSAASGQAGAKTLITDSVEYAASDYSTSAQTGTGLYVSLNCGYKTAPAGTSVPLLNGLPGVGANPVTVNGGLACTDSGQVNPQAADASGTLSGLTNSQLASGSVGSWPSPGCPVQEAFDSWPAGFTGAVFDPASSADVNPDFTAADGVSGQPYVLLGSPAPSAATLALSPGIAGEVPHETTTGGANPAAPGVNQPTASGQANGGGGVNTETGDLTQSDSDFSIPTFGPDLSFDRTYDAQAGQQQELTGNPGPMGYGWTDNWATSVTASSPIPGDIYAVDGLAGAAASGEGLTAYAANGQAPGSAPLGAPGGVLVSGGNVFYADTQGNRVIEVPAASGTQFGIAMTAGEAYTIAGSYTGQLSLSATFSSKAGAAALLHSPTGLAMDSSGDLLIVQGNQVDKLTPAGLLSTIAGTATRGTGGDGVAATSSDLAGPTAVVVDSAGDIYIADSANNRVQEVFASGGDSWGQTMKAGDIYTVAGSAAGTAGRSANGTAGGSSRLSDPQGIAVGNLADLYIADTGNNRVVEMPLSASSKWGFSMTAGDVYDVAGSAAGTAGVSGDGASAFSTALLRAPGSVSLDSAGNMVIADAGNNRIQFVPKAAGTGWNQPMTADDMYTIAGSPAGTAGNSGNGGAAMSALLDAPSSAGTFASGKLWITDTGNNTIREVPATSPFDIAAYAGTGQDLASAGNSGPAVNGQLVSPGGEVADSHGDVFVTDSSNNRVQEIAAYTHTQWGIAMTGGEVYTIAGSATGVAGNTGNSVAARSALLSDPQGLAFDSHGNLLIADFGNDQIRVLIATGGVPAYGISSPAAGDLYTIAGLTSGASGTAGDGGPATSADLFRPYGLAVDAQGDVYIADKDNNRIQEVYEGGQAWGQTMTTGDMYTIAGATAGTAGDSGDGGAAASALLSEPEGLTVDAAGDLLISDTANEQVRMMPVSTGTYYGQKMTARDIYTVAGSTAGTAGFAGDGGPAAGSELHTPIGLATDRDGDLYIADGNNNRVREIASTAGVQWETLMTAGDIYTVAGTGTGASSSGDGGPALLATIFIANSAGTDNNGDLYIGDQSGGQLREVPAGTAATIAPAPGMTSALYPAPGSTIGGTTFPAAITVTQPGGGQVSFFPAQVIGGTLICNQPMVTAGGYCVLPLFQGATLTGNATSGWTFAPSPGSDAYTYSATTGLLTAVTDPAGNKITVASNYPAPGAATSTTAGTWPATSTAITCPATATSCQTIISASGRALVIGSDSTGQVTTVTDPLGRQQSYAYTGSCTPGAACALTRATDPMTNTTSYSYDTANPDPLLASDLLTTTTPNAQTGGPDAGDDTVNTYDSAGRVTTQTDPMGNKTTFAYCVNRADGDCLNSATGTGPVTVTDPDGNQTVYTYAQGTLAGQYTWTGTVGSSLATEETDLPDTAVAGTGSGTDGGLLDTATFDGDNNQTSYTYDSAGNTTATTSPSGGSTANGLATTTATYTSAAQNDEQTCDGTAQASPTDTCNIGVTPPAVVAPGGVINPPASSPPAGVTLTLYDTLGNEIYATTGVYSPSGVFEHSQTTYQLYKNNTITLNGTSIACTHTPPGTSMPCATINADGVVAQLTYNSQGDQTSSSTPDGNPGGELAATTGTFDADGEQLTTVAPDGNLSGADAGNYTTTTAYNADGQQTAVTQGDGAGFSDTPRTTSYGYDGDGNATTVKDPRGFTTTTSYNADDRATLVANPDGDATLTCYDGDGNTVETVPAAGVAANGLTPSSCPTSFPADYNPATKAPLADDATLNAYDGNGNTAAAYTPVSAGQFGFQTTTYSYDGNGNLLTTTAPPTTNDGPDQVTIDAYNTAGQLASDTTGAGTTAASTISYCHDPDGDQTSVVYADGNTSGTAACGTSAPWTVTAASQARYQTTYSYDSAGNPVSTITPANTASSTPATTATYDPSGNMLTRTDPDGVTTTWSYTPLNKIATINYSGNSAHSVAYTYDASGNQTAMTDATGTSGSSYDPFGELTSAQNGAGQTTTYGYNADGQATGITYPLPSAASWATTDTVTYGYDNAGQLTSVTDFNGHQITIGSTPDGLPDSIILGSTGDTTTITYDNSDSPSAISLRNTSTTLQSFTYSDSPAGTILTETDTPSTTQTPAAYSYDAQGRLTSMTPGTSAPHDYGFDASGNLTAMPTGATGTYNSAGELTASTLSGTTTSYTYNADGEQLTSAQGSTTQSSATWNGAGQLSTYTNNAANMSVASYDGNNLRTSTTITQNGGPTVTQGYVWDTVPQVPQLLMDGNSAYVYDGEAPPAEQVNLSTGAITYLIADSLGSIRGTVNSSGALTGTTSYDAWGSPLTPGGLSSFTPFGYAGGYADPDGLIYLVNRYYEPSTGQFISVDPAITVTAQPYSYANDDPVSLTDPAGDVAGIAVKYHLCCWIDVYYNWQRTVQVADEDAGIRTAAITLVCGVASRYLPDPFDRFICDAVKKFIESSHAEAAKIVKNAGGKNAYITANNKYCLAGYIGIQYHWGIPYVASHWWSYKRTSFAGKRTCLKTY